MLATYHPFRGIFYGTSPHFSLSQYALANSLRSLFNRRYKLFGCPPARRSPLRVSLCWSLVAYQNIFSDPCLALTVYALSHYMPLGAERRMHIEHIDLRIAIYHSAILEKSPWKATEIAEFHSTDPAP